MTSDIKSREKTTNSDLFENDTSDGLMSIKEAIAFLNIPEKLVRDFIKDGRLRVVRFNSRVIRVSRQALLDLIAMFETPKVVPSCSEVVLTYAKLCQVADIPSPPSPPPSPSVSPSSSPTPPITPSLSPSSPTSSPPSGAARPDKTYVFEGKVIRLNEKDYALWLKSFRNIPNLLAELLKRDAWLVSQPDKDRAKWFQSTSAWLTRLDRELAPLPDTMGGFPTVLQEKLKSNPEETLMEMLKPIWKGNAKFKTPEETLACFRDWVDDAKLAAYIMLAKTRCPKDILPIKLVHMLAYQGTDPADNRPWQNGYPPPAKSKPAETEQQSDRRRRAENRYEGLNV